MRRYDFAPLYRSTVGFDRLFDLLDSPSGLDSAPSYPPYNIEQTAEDAYRITMAVAGFSTGDIDLEVRDTTLTVTGKKDTKDGGERRFLHQGIAERSFERRFQLADHVIVTGANLENGILNIDLKREIPEALKPRRIEIQDLNASAKQLEGKAA